jgi:N-acetylneuraminic acid mutarotase
MNRRSLVVLLVSGAGFLLFLALLLPPRGAEAGDAPVKPSPAAAAPADISRPVQEGFETGNLPASAFHSAVTTCVPGGCGWTATASDKHGGTYSAFVPDVAQIADQQLVLNAPVAIPASAYNATLSFWHRYTFESTGATYYDGGVLEVSTDGGASWSAASPAFLSGGYNAVIHTGNNNPLAGRNGWSGTTGGAFVQVQVNLLSYAGQNVLIRFREGTDSSQGAAGWWVDDIQLTISSPIACASAIWNLQTGYPSVIAFNATVAFSGRIYSFGGADSTGTPLTTAYSYNPATDSWTSLAALPDGRYGAAAVTDGTSIYILGGNDQAGNSTTTVLRYDPGANTYTPLASYSYGTYLHAAVLMGGKIYRIAGSHSNVSTATVEVYTISTNTWAAATAYPLVVQGLTAMTYNGYLYAAGGSNNGGGGPTAKTYRYDPVTATWDDAGIADLPATRYGSSSALLNGRWALVGGYAGGAINGTAIVWTPAANNWSALPDTMNGRANDGAAVIGQALYVVGGQDSNSQRSNYTRRYLEVPCTAFTPTATATNTPGPSPTACPITFSDVAPSDYFYVPVQYLYCRGAISGYADGTFRPYNNTTRAQLSKIVVLGFALPIQTPVGGAYSFTDVAPGSTFFDYVETATVHNLVTGYGCGVSNPQTGAPEPCDGGNRPYYRAGNNVTRGQLSKIVVAAAGWTLINPPSPTFNDVAPGSTFYAYVETAVCHSILGGYADGSFRPGNPATRGQISKIVYLALQGSACP